jgi:hypothetical protein
MRLSRIPKSAGALVVALVVTGASLGFGQLAGATGPANGTIVPGSAAAVAPFTAGTPFSSGQQINVVIPANSNFQVGQNINIVECAAPGGVVPTDPSACDGLTIQGPTVPVDADGSVNFQSETGQLYSVYALPDAISLGEPPNATPICNLTNECVLYIGQNQNDFTQPHYWSQPFWIAPNGDDLGENPGDGSAPGATVTLSPSSLPNAIINLAYSQTVTASGGTAPYTYTVSAGSLPVGLSLNSSTGAITGTPTATGTSSFTIKATDSLSNTGSQAYSVTVNPAPTITLSPTSLPGATADVAYSQQLSASGGTSPYTFAVTSGALPPGITLSSAGLLSGTPTVVDSSPFTVTATDHNSFTGSQAYTLVVSAPTITLSPTSLPGATAETAYSQQLSASGGTSPYTFAVTSGSLPAGITLSSAGLLSGTATAAGTFPFTVTATDHNSFTGSQAYSLVVSAPAITVTPASLPNGQVNAAYSQQLSASGGDAPTTFAVTSGGLPPGLTLTSAGLLSGTPTASGTTDFTVTATDAHGFTGTKAYALTISSVTAIAISPTSLPAGAAETAYSQQLTASGGIGSPYTFSVASGSLPTGITLTSAGLLSGTSTTSGVFDFTVQAEDANHNLGSQGYALTLNPPTISVSPASLPNGTADNVYPNQTVSASGGDGPYTFAVTGGNPLPAGLTLNASTGVISGTPTTPATYDFNITATDAHGFTGAHAYAVVIAAPTITLSPASLPNATAGVAYSQQLTASGGAGPYTFAVSSGALPSGINLSSAGLLSGTTTATGPFSVTIRAFDAGEFSGTRAYTLTVVAPTIALSPASLPAGTVGTTYHQAITASGGQAPYTYAVTAGSLPAGLTLSGGVLTGTPTASGTSTFTVTATDANLFTGSRAYSLTIQPKQTAHGYWLVAGDGGIFSYGQVGFYGSTGNLTLQRPVVGMTPTGDRKGYWMVATDGGEFAFGDAGYYGSLPGLGYHPAGSGLPKSLNAPIDAMVASPDGKGYLMVAQDGGVFAFGDAQYHGSCPAIGSCNGTVVAVIPNKGETGYWVVTSTGHVYGFGTGSLGQPAGQNSSPITGAAATPSGNGYYVVDALGQVFSYGDANKPGSLPNMVRGDSVVGIVPVDTGTGYWLMTAEGEVFSYGGAPKDGERYPAVLNAPVVTAAGY